MTYTYRQYIDGEWTGASNGGTWDATNPPTEEVVRSVPFGGRADAERAIEAAARAFPAWSRTTPYERAEILMKTARLIRERVDDLYPTNVAESGKPIVNARGDWLGAAALFEWFAEEGKRAYGRTIPARKPGKRMIVLKQPVGVVGTITAWNFPAYNTSRCWAAALAAGCTVVGRPSEYTPLTAMEMVNLMIEAGIPPGVMNLISGDPEAMGQAMLDHPECRKISFTGSTRVGRILMEGAARTFTRLGLELGGNAPVLVFPDADLETVMAEAPMAKCRNVGQVCVAPQRFFVHRKRQEEFLDRVTPQMQSLRVGDGADPETEVGPLINARQRERVEELVGDAVGRGAKLLAGGARPESLSKGFFYQPTVLAEIGPETRLLTEEVFGPVLPVVPFDDLDEVLALANSTPYGLAAYVFTNDLKTAVHVAERLEFGMVGVNEWTPQALEAPFGGWKQSGMGKECGQEGLEDYLETKLVGIGGLD